MASRYGRRASRNQPAAVPNRSQTAPNRPAATIATMSDANGASPNNSAGEDRQFVHFSFYKLDRAWRRLPAAEQEAGRAELADVIEAFGERFPVRAYTMAGLRPDADLMLWKVSERLEDFQE